MEYTLQSTDLFRMLTKAAEIGADKALRKCGLTKPMITKKQAYELFNRPAVDRALKAGDLKTVKKGGKTSNVYILRTDFDEWVLKDELLSRAIKDL